MSISASSHTSSNKNSSSSLHDSPSDYAPSLPSSTCSQDSASCKTQCPSCSILQTWTSPLSSAMQVSSPLCLCCLCTTFEISLTRCSLRTLLPRTLAQQPLPVNVVIQSTLLLWVVLVQFIQFAHQSSFK